jgi:hypothetical protein
LREVCDKKLLKKWFYKSKKSDNIIIERRNIKWKNL